MALNLAAIVPMKPVGQAKSRLASHLSEKQRQGLALMMLDRVLRAAQGCATIRTTWVVGGDESVRRLAVKAGTEWLDDGGRGLNDALWFAFDKWFREGGDSFLFLPADLPFLGTYDLERLLATSKGGQCVVISPAKRDGGTNAMLVPRDYRFRPRFGQGSFLRHLHEVTRLGYPVACYFSEAVGLDLDTIEDVKACLLRYPTLLEDAGSFIGGSQVQSSRLTPNRCARVLA